MSTETKSPVTRVVTKGGRIRFSYLNAFVARAAQEGQKPKFSLSAIIRKDDKENLKLIRDAIEAAKEAGKAKLAVNGKIPGNIKMPLRDADIDRPGDDTYAGCYFVNCSSSQKPGIVDENRQAILNENDIYSGCYGNLDINFYAFNTSGNKGVAAGLNNIQKIRDGEPLSGRQSAENAFGEDNSNDDL